MHHTLQPAGDGDLDMLWSFPQGLFSPTGEKLKGMMEDCMVNPVMAGVHKEP